MAKTQPEAPGPIDPVDADEPYVLCYHDGLSFFYHHAEHPRTRSESQARCVKLASLAIGVVCCGCWQPITPASREWQE
jgi:hypothetical protein